MNHHKVQNKRAIAELKLLPTDLLSQMQGITYKCKFHPAFVVFIKGLVLNILQPHVAWIELKHEI